MDHARNTGCNLVVPQCGTIHLDGYSTGHRVQKWLKKYRIPMKDLKNMAPCAENDEDHIAQPSEMWHFPWDFAMGSGSAAQFSNRAWPRPATPGDPRPCPMTKIHGTMEVFNGSSIVNDGWLVGQGHPSEKI